MPGKALSHSILLCLAAVALMGLVGAGTADAEPDYTGVRLVDLADGTTPSWCHLNLQLLSEPTGWIGYRDINILKRQFSTLTTSPVYYRAFVSDRNVYVFSSQVGQSLSEFGVETGRYSLASGRPQASCVSVRRSTALDVYVWCVKPHALLAVRANDPANPVRQGEIELPETPRDIFAQFRQNRYTIFTVNGTDSVRVYQLPTYNWVTPERRGAIDTPGDACAMAHQDSMLFIADGIEGVQVIDVTNLDALVQAGQYRTVGPAKQVAVRDTLLFVAEWDAGVEILNIASVDSIFPVAWIDTPGRAFDVAVQGTRLLVADWDGGLRVYDFARPDSIFLYGFFGVGGQYHSVAVSDSVVVAGDYTGLKIFCLGPDRFPPVITNTVTQTPYFRDYLRTYVLASECLEDIPTAKQLILPRQSLVDDFEGYANSDSLKRYWSAADAADTVSIATRAFEGSQSMRFGITLPRNVTRKLNRSFSTPRNWSLFDRLTFHFKAGTDTLMGRVRATVFTTAGDSVAGDRILVGSGWQEYSLNLSSLTSREQISRVQIGVSSTRTDITVTGGLLVDHLLLKKVDVDSSKDPEAVFLGDTLDVDLRVVSEERNLYMGDFHLVPSDTGMINAILTTATDNFGNTATKMKEFRAQLVVPSAGGVLRSPDSRLSLAVPPAATQTESFFFILPRESASLSPLPESARLLGRSYEVGMSGGDLLRDVDVVFHLDRSSVAGVDPEDLGLYRQDGNGWQYLGGRFDAKNLTIRVSASDLGTLAAMANPNRPTVEEPASVAFRGYPNPFNPNTTISFTCPARSHVSLGIYDVAGRLVRSLVNDVRSPGAQFVTWNGMDDGSVPATSGIYFARLEMAGETRTIKLVLIR